MKTAVIITAAGSSDRFNTNGVKKEFATLNGHSVLFNSVYPFTRLDYVSFIVVTYKKGTLSQTKEVLENLTEKKEFIFVQGGSTRRESVLNALEKINEIHKDTDFVGIHDGARPFVSESLIDRTFEKAFETGASAPVVNVRDTLVYMNEDSSFGSKVERDRVRAVQTPQVFRFSEILDCHRKADSSKLYFTDDTTVFTSCGKKVFPVEGDVRNIKITFAEDLEK